MQNNHDPKIAYNKLPLIPVDGFNPDDPDILKKSLAVSQSIASLNTLLGADDNNIIFSIDLMSPLYVPEAVMSSSIEEIITTNESVYQARLFEDDEISPQDKEVMNYSKALLTGFGLLAKNKFLATNQFIAIQKVLEPSNSGLRKLPGTKLANPKTGKVYYTPPDNEQDIRRLLKNFEDYFNEDAPAHEVFTRAAILHYQFESIHPFHDGNGRTGRMLIPLYLAAQGSLSLPLLFVSKYILENRDEYYRLLRAVTQKNEWKSWVMYMLEALDTQAVYTLESLQKINQFKSKLEKRLVDNNSRGYARDVADFLYTNPYFVQHEFEEQLSVSYATARKYLQQLIDQNIIVKRKQTGKNRFIYACPEYIKLLKKL